MKKHFLLFFFLVFVLTDFLQAQSARSGKDYAYFFYVSDFQDRNWADLPETGREAIAIANELRSNYGFQVETIANPTRQEILNKIKQVNNRRYDKDDQVLFFFSTHGHYDENQDEGFLIPADGQYNDTYGDSWISYANLGRRITLNKAEHVLLALDACYSGAFGIRNKARPGTTPWEADKEVDCQEKTNRALKYNSRLYFSSGSKKQRTPARSLFANRWLEVLRKGEELGVLRSDDLRYYLNRIAFPEPEDGSFTNHQANGDFVFVHKNACLSANNQQAKDNQHWQQYLTSSSKELLIEHLNRYPGCSHYQTALNLIAVPDRSTKSAPDKMVFVQGGTFQMGSKDGEDDEKPVHSVTVDDYYISRYEVSVDEFAQFINATGYETDADKNGGSYKWDGKEWKLQEGKNWLYNAAWEKRPTSDYDHPVIHVSWNDAVAYCNWLSEQKGFQPVYTINGDKISANWNANGYRLPTEAEWEFAARSRGKNYKYAWGNGNPIGSVADESAKKKFSSWTIWDNYTDGYIYTAPTNQFEQGDLGLFNMTGNVREWCWDWYDKEYYASSKNSSNPKGPNSGSYRVFRGGSWNYRPSLLRCANRSDYNPSYGNGNVGFRLSRAGR